MGSNTCWAAEDNVLLVAEVLAIHDLRARRTGEVPHAASRGRSDTNRFGAEHVGHRAMCFAVRAERGKRLAVEPRAVAVRAFEQWRRADVHGVHGARASRTAHRRVAVGAGGFGATFGAELHADEHGAEARRTAHGRERRAAVVAAFGGSAGGRRAAGGAVERGGHCLP